MLAAFTLDRRFLALLRIAFGLILLIDLSIRLPDVVVFYTDQGFLPSNYFLPDRVPYLWSLLWFNSDPNWVYLHLGVQFISALMLILGYKTRWFLLISWLLLLSLDNRNIFVLHGGDKTLRIMMFWALFLPLNDRWSLDNCLKKEDERNKEDNNYIGIPSIIYILQLCIIYWFAGLWKLNPLWLNQKRGVIEAFSNTFFNTPAAEFLLNFSDYLGVLDIITIVTELGLPFLVFFTKWQIRLITVIAFLTLHLTFGTVLSLGLFPFMSGIVWLALFPNKNIFSKTEVDKNIARDLIITILFSLVIFNNIATLEIPNYWKGFKMNSTIDRLLTTIHLEQKWYMFSSVFPHGQLKILLNKDGQELSVFDPKHYPSHRWRVYYYYLAATASEDHKEGKLLADYYCRTQNIDEVTIDFTRKDSLKPDVNYNNTYKCKA